MGENYGTDAFSFRENGLGAVPSTLTEKKQKTKQFYKVVIGCIIGEAQTIIEKGHFKAKRPKAIQIIMIATCLIALNTFLAPNLKWPQL